MATASVQYTFVPLTDIESSEVNKNFTDLVTFLNNFVIHTDASRVFTAIPTGPASDPVSDDQFARKRYVDRRAHGGIGSGTTDGSGFLTITHGAPFTPIAVVAVPRSPIAGVPVFGSLALDSVGATTFRIRAFENTGGSLVSTAVTIHYICLRANT